MTYSAETIKHLSKFILGDDASRAWLQQNNFPELVLLGLALDYNDSALLELTKQKNIELVTLVHAVQDDKHAYNWFVQNKKYIWAALVKVTYKDHEAEAWLMKNGLPHFVELGRAIRKNEDDQAPDDIVGLSRKFLNLFKKKK